MTNLNKIVLIGKIADDPAVKNTEEGQGLTKFILAVARPQRADGTPGETDFIDVVSFGRQAEIAGQYFKKGKLALVEGRIQVRTFNDAGGNKKWVNEVVSSNLMLLEGKQPAAAMMPAENTEEEALSSAAPALKDAGPVPAEDDIPF